ASERRSRQARGDEEGEEHEQQGAHQAQRKQGPLGPGTVREPSRGDLSHGSTREREDEQARPDEVREERETALVGETGEHVDKQDQEEWDREQGPTGDGRVTPIPRSVVGQGPGPEERCHRDGGYGGVSGDGRQRSADAEGGEDEKWTRRATVREEPERHGANPIEPEAECEEEPEGERIRMEIVAPCEIQEHRDREDVRMHHAVQEPEEGDDLPILPSHSTTTR